MLEQLVPLQEVQAEQVANLLVAQALQILDLQVILHKEVDLHIKEAVAHQVKEVAVLLCGQVHQVALDEICHTTQRLHLLHRMQAVLVEL